MHILENEETMNADIKNEKNNDIEKPQVFLKCITFNDNTQLQLNKSSIIVFTGPNNSGKSQVLKDVEYYFDPNYQGRQIVITNIECNFQGVIDETNFLNERFSEDAQGKYQLLEAGSAFDIDLLQQLWKDKTLYNGLHRLFIKRLSTEIRLTSSNALIRSCHPERHPIYKLNKNERLAEKLSAFFHQAFDVDLVVNRNEMSSIPLHIGQAPDKKSFTIETQDDYYNLVDQLPKLQDQGDGMRSFASILLDTFTSDYSITLIDEPEAFLHPPQAKLLGKMLAKNNPNNRQLLISTHSEDFLQGLLEADNNNVTVIRINREKNINKMSILKNEEIQKLWRTPLLRYSNILSGLFHDKVIVSESDYDCLFYQAIIDAIYESNSENAPDILFTHCGGKSRIKDVVIALKAVNVPVVAICDFDVINSSQIFKPIAKSFGLDWKILLHKGMKTIYDIMNAKENNPWDHIKKIGKAGLLGDAPAAYDNIESICQSVGFFIVPVGEMECFDKTINKEKKEWVYQVLENYNLAIEPKLENARNFVKLLINYK